MTKTIFKQNSENLSRLVNMQGGDPGFFLLATHSFIESYLREQYDMYGTDYSFPDLLYHFRTDKIKNTTGFVSGLEVLNIFKSKQETANAVRHRFCKIDPDEAAAAAYRLIQFCRLISVDCAAEIKRLEDSLGIWEERSCSWDRLKELKNIKWELFQTRRRNKEILDELDELKKNQIETEHYSIQIRSLEIEIDNLKNQKDVKDEKVDELRAQKFQLECEKKKSDARISELESVNQYIQNLSRVSNYTRTRFDYERDITRLTKEQQRVLDVISLTDDFLIKGGAGTGKTLVLIKALEKAVSGEQGELNFGDGPVTVKLLTFNKTLVKYDRYLAEVLEYKGEADLITTVDKYIFTKLRSIDSRYSIQYGRLAEELASELNSTDFLNNTELANEIESFLFARDITEDEYVNKRIARKGLKKPLTAQQRKKVWDIREAFISRMNETLLFTKNYSRKIILNSIDIQQEDSQLKDADYIFIDEVQDLSAVDIKVIKACTRRAVIMAGDSDQSIYQPGFTFSRGNIDIRGTAKILRTNFRNTVEIHELAEKYRACQESIDHDTQPEAFRLGPVPELYQGENKNELLSMIIQRVKLFVEDLHYDPENISILVPTTKDVEMVQEALAASGYEGANLKDDNFSFNQRALIRVSTLHSSKGLDFPIVLLLLYKVPYTGRFYDDDTRHKMERNLIYVSMTRAMDHLNVFTLEGEKKAEISDLANLFSEE